MRRTTTAQPLVLLSAFAVLLASCGLGGQDSELVEAQLAESSGFTAAEDQSTVPAASAEQAATDVESASGVLRVEIPLDETTPTDESGDATADASSSTTSTSPTMLDGTSSSTATVAPTTAAPTTAAPTTAESAVSPTTAAPTTVAPTTAAPTTAAPTTAAPTTAAPTTAEPTTTTSQPNRPTSGLTYKGILAAGDNEITAFDNARKTVKGLFLAEGVQAGNLVELSRQSSEQTNGVRATTVSDIEQAMLGLNVGDGDACILFLTSHGNKQMWFVRGDSGLTPDKLDQILSASCGNRPTIALISACYSGIFIGPLARPNRVVLTAASATNTSFGCSPEATFTYWDGCLITHFAQATTWEDLYGKVTGCIEGKEASAGVTPSRPQAHFGSEVANMSILSG